MADYMMPYICKRMRNAGSRFVRFGYTISGSLRPIFLAHATSNTLFANCFIMNITTHVIVVSITCNRPVMGANRREYGIYRCGSMVFRLRCYARKGT
jgi:hypothetical protein